MLTPAASSDTLSAAAESAAERQQTLCKFDDGSTVSFRVGVSEDRNRRYRRVMEDTHCYLPDFRGMQGQGFFSIFDGHGGKAAAEWCGSHFHETLGACLDRTEGKQPTEEVLVEAFLEADEQLGSTPHGHSGCTVITALLMVEPCGAPQDSATEPHSAWKRALYTANVGDARAVLCRNGQAQRMSYDHKGSDPHESQRVTDKGGFMLGGRVNGMLAVTRALGDTAMKEFVIGHPYTQHVELCADDTWLILACDGLWDVCEDQTAVDLIKDLDDAQEASRVLLAYALDNFSADNLTIMAIRLS